MTTKLNDQLLSNRETAKKIAGSHVSGWKTCIVEAREHSKKKVCYIGIIFLPIDKAIAGFVNQCHDGTSQTVIEVY